MKSLILFVMAFAACSARILPSKTVGSSTNIPWSNSDISDIARAPHGHSNPYRRSPVAQSTQSGTVDPKTGLTAEWANKTEAVCESAMAALNGNPGNPSGMAVCYNLPYLDNTTGVFQADLRLFVISDSTGVWTGIGSNQVNLNLAYLGATVSSQMRLLKVRSTINTNINLASSSLSKRQAQTASLVQSFQFVGKINSNLLAPSMNSSQIQALLIPVITVTAINPQGQNVNATLSSQMTSFVNGVFAGAGTPITDSAQASATAIANHDLKFVVPGQKIAIFPTGLIITFAWTVLFMLNLAYGTYGRFQFREQYRRRLITRGRTTKTI